MGRNKKPTELKKIQGTYRKDRELKDRIKPKPATDLPIPDYFDQVAKETFIKITNELKENGILGDVDIEMLHAYSFQISIMTEAALSIMLHGHTVAHTNQSGFTNIVKNPSIAIYNEAMEKANKVAAQFGFTAASREKITVKPKEKEPSKMQQMLQAARERRITNKS